MPRRGPSPHPCGYVAKLRIRNIFVNFSLSILKANLNQEWLRQRANSRLEGAKSTPHFGLIAQYAEPFTSVQTQIMVQPAEGGQLHPGRPLNVAKAKATRSVVIECRFVL